MSKHFSFLKSIFILIIGIPFFAFAGNEKYIARKAGSEIFPQANISIQDKNFPNVLSNAQYVNSKGIIMLSIDQYNKSLPLNLDQSVEFSVEYYKKDGTKVSPSIGPITLSVSNINAKVKDKDYIVIDDAINDPYSISVTVTKVNGSAVASTFLSPYVNFEVSIEVERYYNLDLVSVPFASGSGKIQGEKVNKSLFLSWDHLHGAEIYDLEYTYVDDYSLVSLDTKADASTLNYDFTFNSTRVVTDKNYYEIPLTYDRGYLLYRVRGKGKAFGTTLYEVATKWSSENPSFGTTVSSFVDKFAIEGKTINNFQVTSSFAEEGKRKDVVSYFDGSLRNRQVVTKSNSTNHYIVAETFYDKEGRPIAQTLPVPVSGKKDFSYLEKFHILDGTDRGVSKSDFAGTGCTSPAPKFSNTSGASQYYSSNNSFLEGELEKKNYIPDAEGYPYTQTEYTQDNTGRVKRQSGVGKDFKLGSTHETKYFYGKPEQEELDKLFGSNAGIAAYYKKNMIVDGNGEVSVSYLDQTGKVVATAIAGDLSKPSPLLKLDGGPNPQDIDDVTIQAIRRCPNPGNEADPDNQYCNPSNYIQGNSLVYSKELIVPVGQTYKFDYLFEAMSQQGCGDICYNCVYDLEISLLDECGTEKITPVAIKEIGIGDNDGISNACLSSSTIYSNHLDEKEIWLEAGKYTLVKKLTVNEKKINEYVEDYLANCIKTQEQFKLEENENIEFNSLCEELTCQTCLLSLGYDEDLSLDNNYTVYKSNYPNSTLSLNDYELSLKECKELCEPTNNCENSYGMMLSHMSPGGQYASTDPTSESWSMSVFNKNSYLNSIAGDWGIQRKELFRFPKLNGVTVAYPLEDNQNPFYVPLQKYTVDGENGQEEVYDPAITDLSKIKRGDFDENGKFTESASGSELAILPVYLKDFKDFAAIWKSHWAQYQVEYHPEYCYYETCKKYNDIDPTLKYSSNDFDDRISFIKKYADAIKPTGPEKTLPPLNTVNPNFDKRFTFNLLDISSQSVTVVTDLVDKDPYFKGTDPIVVARRDEMIRRLEKYNSTEYNGSEYDGPELNIKKTIAISTFCGSMYYANNAMLNIPECTSFGSGTEEEQDAQWQAYVSMYLGEKQAIQQKEADLYCMNTSTKGGFNGCIGDPQFSPFNGLPNEYYAGGINSFFLNPTEPCNVFYYKLYKNAQKAFISKDDSQKKSGICDYEKNQSSLDRIRAKADMNVYLMSGQCPLTKDFELFMNDLASKNRLLASETPIIKTAISQKLYKWARYTANGETPSPGSFVSYTLRLQSGTSTDYVKDYKISKTIATLPPIADNATVIHLEIGVNQDYKFVDKADNFKEYLIDMNFNGTPVTTDNASNVIAPGRFKTKIKGIRNLMFRQENPLGNFHFFGDMEIEIYDGTKYIGTNYYVKIKGYTTFPLNAECDFTNVCETSEDGTDLSALLNSMVMQGDLSVQNKSMYADPDPDGEPVFNYESLLTPNLKKYFNPNYLNSHYTFTSGLEGDKIEISIINYNSDEDMKIVLEPNEALPAGVVLNPAKIKSFSCYDITTNPEANEFFFTATQEGTTAETVYSFSMKGTVSTYDDATNGPLFKFKKCGPPTPDICKTQEVENSKHVLDFLDEFVGDRKTVNGNNIVTGNYAFANGNQYFIGDNLVFNAELKKQLGTYKTYYAMVTTNEISETSTTPRVPASKLNIELCSRDDQTQCIEGSNINFTLEFAEEHGEIEFTNIVGFAGLKPDYTNSKQGKAYEFTLYAICKVATSAFAVNVKMKGSSVFPVAECQLGCFAGKENLVINGDFSDPTLLPDACGGCMCQLPDESWDPNNNEVPQMVSPTFKSDYCLAKEWDNRGWGAIIFARRPQDAGLDWDGYDHTNGRGYFLYADNKFQEKNPLKKRAWYQEVSVEPGIYEFTAYAMNLHQMDVPNDGNCTGCKARSYAYDVLGPGTANYYVTNRCNLDELEDVEEPEEINSKYHDVFGKFNLEDKIFLKLNISKSPYNIDCDPEDPDPNKECARALLSYLSPEGLTCKNGWVKITTVWENTNYTGKVTLDVSSIDPYYYGGDFGLDDISFSKICTPVISEPAEEKTEITACQEMVNNLKTINAELKYSRNKEKLRQDFRTNYINKCLKAPEEFRFSYKDYEYQYTLYYYDQAGNLVKTVPPQGVDVIKDDAQLTEIQNDRLNKTFTPGLQPKHTLPTTYYYNSLNQLTAQSVPDHDKLNIFNGVSIAGLEDFNILGIQFKDGLNGYLVAKETVPDPNELYPDRAHIFVTKDGGNEWTELTKLGLLDLKDIQFVPGSDQVGHTVGTNGGLLRTENGGEDWLFKPVGTTNALTKVHFFDVNHGLAFESDGSIWTTRDKGETWLKTNPLSNPGTITDVHFNGTTGFVISNYQGSQKIYFTSNKGDTWADFGAKYRVAGLNTISVAETGKVYAAGEAGILLKSVDSGENWQFVYADADNKAFTKLHFYRESAGCGILNNKVVYTEDGGVTWKPSNLPDGVIKDFKIEDKDGYCLSADKKIYRTKDGGKTWILSSPSLDLSSVITENVTTFFYDSPKLVVGTENGKLYVNSNPLSSQYAWTALSLPKNKAVKSILIPSVTDAALILIEDGLGTGSVYYSSDVFATPVVWSAEKKTNIQEIKCLEGKYYALANTGALYSSNDGNAWTDENTISSDLKSIDKVSGKFVAVGGRKIYKSTTVVTNNDQFNSKSENIKLDPFRGVYCEDAEHVYLTGKDGLFFKYNASDKTFYQFLVPTNADLNKVVISGSKGVIAGKKGSLLYSTNANTESQWTVSTLNTGTDKAITDLALVSPNSVFASTEDHSVYTSSDFGATFTKHNTPANFSLDAISFSNAQKGIAAGKSGTVVISTDGGITWKDVTTIDPLKLTATFHVKNSQTGYAVGKNSTIVKTTDLGQTWTPLKAGISTAKNFTSVSFKDANNGIVVGNSIVLRTTNGGTSWEALVAAPAFNYNSVSVFDKFILAVGDGGNIAKSTDFGATWSTMNTGTANLNSVYVLDSKNAFAVGNNGTILKMNAAGTSWTPTAISSLANTKLNTVYFTNIKTGYIVGANGTFLKTVDGGVTWLPKELNTTSDITNINFIDDNHAFVSGTDGYVSKVTDFSEEVSSRFWYDELGRLVVSQNSKQYNYNPKRYSYTVYDDLGRIIEVGELAPSTDVETLLSGSQINSDLLKIWINNTPLANKFEITRTQYDVSGLSETTQVNLLGSKLDKGTLRNRVATITYRSKGNSTIDHATHFNYDVHGNVKELVQEIPYLYAFNQHYKKMRYEYDLISGKVNKVIYQENQPDQFIHKYEYDAENRITSVKTSEDGIVWAEDANYTYYAHGPLSRIEYGDLKVQGQDFAYTIQGWIKGVNATNISSESDPGNDGLATSINKNVGKDIYSYSLNYFDGDYKAVNSNFLGNRTNSEFGTAIKGQGYDFNLYNGNISSMVTTILSSGGSENSPDIVDVQGTAYTYDKLNRIKSMQAYANFDLANNAWLSSGATASYSSTYKYDNNGNIINLQRKNKAGEVFDDLTYNYDVINNQTPGLTIGEAKLRSNKLYLVDDQVTTAIASDIEDQGVFISEHEDINEDNNYQYDEIGNLKYDRSEGIHKIIWNVSGKVDMIINNGIKYGEHSKFLYDIKGSRIAKITKKTIAGESLEDIENLDWLSNCPSCNYTWYLRDASGTIISIYSQTPNAGHFDFKLDEVPLYGSSRIGEYKPYKLLAIRSSDFTSQYSPPSPTNLGYRGYTYNLNKKYYELSNHLDNIHTVITDFRKYDNLQYLPLVEFSQDYFPFGSLMDGRGLASGSVYRYGFNGMEKDDEVAGDGNSYSTEFRQFDPRLGRWFSIDPQSESFPNESPYGFVFNNPITSTDKKGDCPDGINCDDYDPSYYSPTGQVVGVPSDAGVNQVLEVDGMKIISSFYGNDKKGNFYYYSWNDESKSFNSVNDDGSWGDKWDASFSVDMVNQIKTMNQEVYGLFQAATWKKAWGNFQWKISSPWYYPNATYQSLINIPGVMADFYNSNDKTAQVWGSSARFFAFGGASSYYGAASMYSNSFIGAFRVQTPGLTGSKELILPINGGLIWNTKEFKKMMLYVTFGDYNRATTFLAQKGSGSYLVHYLMDADYVKVIQRQSHPQTGKPKGFQSIMQSDYHSYRYTNLGIGPGKLDGFFKYMKPGSARKLGY